MATLFDLAQQYLNRALPETFRYDRTITRPGPITRPEPIPGPVVPLLPRPGGNAEGFSVYNPDPNRTRDKSNYIDPFKFNPDDNLGTSDYGYPGSPRTGVMGLYDQYKNLPMGSKIGLGAMSALSGGAILPVAAGVVGAGKLIGGFLPAVNPRAILENQALGAGIALDDVGRIVQGQGDYDSAENVMAGYN